MGLNALKIVEEEFQKLLDSTGDDEWTRDRIFTLEARIKDRIEKECIEIPEEEFCCFCGETEPNCAGGGFDDGIPAHDFAKGGISKLDIPDCDGCHAPHAADDRFWRQDAACEPPYKTNLCGDCVRALKEDGVSIEVYHEPPVRPLGVPPIEDDIPF